MITIDSFTKINNDSNGNPRYVIHFLDVLNNFEKDEREGIEYRYQKALKKMKPFDGKKFHNKQYGGGIAFQTYNLNNLVKKLNDRKGENENHNVNN
jgi:hypothetical protein